MGNIWRFSYIAGENGGGVFLLIYLACVALVGATIVIGELALGRQAQLDAVSSALAGLIILATVGMI